MELNSLEDLFKLEIQDMYSMEQQIISILPKVAESATDEELKSTLLEHLEITKNQAKRLESIAKQYGIINLEAKVCKGMEGIIAEGKEILELTGDDATKDAAIIGAAQRVEHYEIASYGTAIAHAEELGLEDIADTLTETLEEEEDADEALTALAEDTINQEAEE